MAMDELIQIDPNQLRHDGATIKSLSAQLDNELKDLRSYLKTQVEPNWDGDSSEEYKTAQAQWDASADEIMEIMRVIGESCEVAADEYDHTEGTNKKRFAH